MLQIYRNCENVNKIEDFDKTKEKTIKMAMNEVNVTFSIRDDDLSSNGPAKFTATRFDNKSAMSSWYNKSEGLYMTELEGNSIKTTIRTWS